MSRKLIKKLLREHITLSVTDETPETSSYTILHKGREAGNLTIGKATPDLGEDTLRLHDIRIDKDYSSLATISETIIALWIAFPEINKIVLTVPAMSRNFWGKIGATRLNDTFYFIQRGH